MSGEEQTIRTGAKSGDRLVPFAAGLAHSPGETSPTRVLQDKVLAPRVRISQDTLHYRPEDW